MKEGYEFNCVDPDKGLYMANDSDDEIESSLNAIRKTLASMQDVSKVRRAVKQHLRELYMKGYCRGWEAKADFDSIDKSAF